MKHYEKVFTNHQGLFQYQQRLFRFAGKYLSIFMITFLQINRHL